MALYALFYLSFFALLERTIQTPDLWVHCQLDDLIPFCKYAIVPYILWFPWIPFTLFYLLYKAPREDFWRLCIPLFTGMTMTLLFYAIVPNGLALRPKYVPGTDIFAQLVRMIYRSDTPMNVCPSIHVFNSVTLMLAYYRSAIFDASRRRWMRSAAMVLCVSISLSTILLKQHSVIDVVFGAAGAVAGLCRHRFAEKPGAAPRAPRAGEAVNKSTGVLSLQRKNQRNSKCPNKKRPVCAMLQAGRF